MSSTPIRILPPSLPTRGQPAETPWRLALVLVFQCAEGLSDEQAAEAVRSRIDWKYALSLELTDPGFDASVLSEFRSRLVAGGAEMQLLEAMLARFKAVGLGYPLGEARGRQRTDSTHVLAAAPWGYPALNRFACIGEPMRQALNSLAVAAPTWLQAHLHPDWVERYGARFDDYRLPKREAARTALAEQIGADGGALLHAIYQGDAPGWLRELPAIETLRRVWVQQFYAATATTPVRWRSTADLPPAAQMINTPYDIEARYGCKRTTTWTGYKVHVTETCDDDGLHLITHVETTSATTPDWSAQAVIHSALAGKELLPAEHLLDGGYVDSEVLVTSQGQHALEVVGPVRANGGWQARAGTGFDVSCFTLDWEARRATCPQGHGSHKWSATHDTQGRQIINIRFGVATCAACPVRAQCTRSQHGPRELTVRPQAQHEALQAARAYQQTEAFKTRYAARAGVEGTLSQGIRMVGLRRARYVGLAKTIPSDYPAWANCTADRHGHSY